MKTRQVATLLIATVGLRPRCLANEEKRYGSDWFPPSMKSTVESRPPASSGSWVLNAMNSATTDAAPPLSTIRRWGEKGLSNESKRGKPREKCGNDEAERNDKALLWTAIVSVRWMSDQPSGTGASLHSMLPSSSRPHPMQRPLSGSMVSSVGPRSRLTRRTQLQLEQ